VLNEDASDSYILLFHEHMRRSPVVGRDCRVSAILNQDATNVTISLLRFNM
jgi:hypothetical protein